MENGRGRLLHPACPVTHLDVLEVDVLNDQGSFSNHGTRCSHVSSRSQVDYLPVLHVETKSKIHYTRTLSVIDKCVRRFLFLGSMEKSCSGGVHRD